MKRDNRRLLGISFFTLALFCFIVVQFYKLQIVEGEKWSKKAKAQHQFSVVEPYRRGRIFANSALKEKHPKQEDPIVFDVKRYHLYADPIAVPEKVRDEIVEKLSELLALKDKGWVQEQFEKKSRSRRLKMWLNEREKKVLTSWWRPFARWKKIPSNALYFEEDYKRAYPYGNLLGAVLHTVRDERDPKTRQAIPTGGLELQFDSELRGKKGKRLRLRSPSHSLEEGVLVDPAEDGADLYLTIDRYIQAIAEEEIERAVKEAGAKSGWAVMMNPHTGEIYALAQYPFFDPSNYRDYYNDPGKTEATKLWAITDCFEPGSTMKPISIAIGMLANKELERQGKETIFDPAAMIPTHDGTFPGRKQPIRDVRKHELLNMYLAIQKSSNIYVAKLIQRVIGTLGDRWYRDQLSQTFGFGKATGIELPSETTGLLPSLDKSYGSGRPQWSIPTPYSLSFGYNLLTTSMQLLKAYAPLCNGGYEVQPTLIKKIVKGEEILYDHLNEERKQIFDAEISREITYALKSVTKLGGAGFRADIPGYTQAGKTGTTEKIVHGTYSKKHHYSSFIGFTPAFEPKFLLYIAIDEPEYRYLPGIGSIHFGGRCAAPVFKHIMEKTYRYLGIPPDDPENSDWAEEMEILESLYRTHN